VAAPISAQSSVRLTPEIVVGMQQLALEQQRLLGPRAPWHVGDVAWGLRQHEGREPEWRFRLWRDDGDRVVAWSWLKGDRGLLEYDLHPEHRHLLDEILAEPDAKEAVALEDDEEARIVLARHGFTKPGRAIHFNHRAVPEAPTPPPLPAGFRYRTVEPEDIAERVAVHRDVWEPSRVTESSYRNVIAQWPYRGSLDCVVEAPDGRFASYVLIWPDDENGVGLFEPVGTRVEFRRRGLGAAVCTFGLQRLREEGMRRAVVGCDTDSACALYESIGFRRSWTITSYAR
jgi:ribosomal protein S18 acetylase RimI-like enzyme